MFFDNIYVNFNQDLNINSISSYKTIMSKFINLYAKIYSYKYKNVKELYSDAIIYSKYYLYYKTQNCVYSDDIMQIIYDVDYLN